MELRFYEDQHKYISDDGKPWRSITAIVGALQQPFDWTPEQSSTNKKKDHEWYGMDRVEMQAAWDAENQRAKDLGHWYHLRKELETLELPGVVECIYKDGAKIAPDQKLKDGIYPEHLIHMESARICGQSDLVTVEGNYFDIDDYKTCKDIHMESYKHYETGHKKMKSPVNHLMDCSYIHYSIQLSLYAYMIQRHNPFLQVRNLTLHHVLFEEEGKDKYGYPIYKKDANEDYIVKDVKKIPVKYLKNEVTAIVMAIKQGRL